MDSPNITLPKRVRGFPQQLGEMLADVPIGAPELVTGLFLLLRQAGMKIAYGDVDVLCGHATQFLYAREQPDCVQLAYVPPVETLFKAARVEWSEVIPSGMEPAFEVIAQAVNAEALVLGRLKRCVLFYGCGGTDWERCVVYSPLGNGQQELIRSILDCEQHEWRFQLDEGNTFISVQAAPRQVDQLKDLCHTIARRAVRAWKNPQLAGCAAGEAAYRALEADLVAANVVQMPEHWNFWLKRGLKMQWLARESLADFFERNAPRFGGAERNTFSKAGFYYRQCWKEWQNFQEQVQANPTQPQRGTTDVVARAREWESKAVNELLRVIA
jgi:hypothetical protein